MHNSLLKILKKMTYRPLSILHSISKYYCASSIRLLIYILSLIVNLVTSKFLLYGLAHSIWKDCGTRETFYKRGWASCSIDSLPRGREALGLFFYGYVPLVSQSPYPIIVYSVANYRPILVTFGQICNFRDPNLVAFFLCIYLILNEDWLKNSLLFTYSKYEELSYP